MAESTPKPRWYRLSPDRLIFGLLAVELLLLLSERFQWFAFNEKKGYTVLIAVAAVCVVVVVMFLWFAASLLFRLRFQFTVRSLVVLVVTVAIPCGWLAVKMRQAEKQRKAVEAIEEMYGDVYYDYYRKENGDFDLWAEPPTPAWLRELLGDHFFSDVIGVGLSSWLPELQVSDTELEHLAGLTKLSNLDLSRARITDVGLQRLKGLPRLGLLNISSTQVTDDGLEHLRGLTNLWMLSLGYTQVTDKGGEHLKGLTSLNHLDLRGTQVTEQGINRLQKALPNCEIIWDGDTAHPQ